MNENNAPGVTEITAPGANPLKKYFRQPKLYIELPSKGRWYPKGSINMTETGELPVYAMTAKDELTLKTPDALLNGQATVEIIQSCLPNILDAWQMPSIDIDAILIAIRIATYGDQLDLTVTPPQTEEEKVFSINLRELLETLGTSVFEESVAMTDSELEIKVRPVTYREFSTASLATFQEERIIQLANTDDMDPNQKLEQFNIGFNKLRDLTIGLISNSIVSITVGEEVVTNQLHIKDFISNAEKTVYKFITDHIEKQKSNFAIQPLTARSEPEDIKNGAPETYQVPIIFDQTNFFV